MESDQLLTLRVCSRFSIVSLQDIPARSTEVRLKPPPPPTLEDQTFDPEAFLPRYPLELSHQDLSALGLDHRQWQAWERAATCPQTALEWSKRQTAMLRTTQEEAEFAAKLHRTTVEEATNRSWKAVCVTIGSSPRWIDYPMSLVTPTCYGCNRPLHLYSFYIRQEAPLLQGICPGCLLEREWRREYQVARWEARVAQLKVSTEDQFVESQRSSYLSAWKVDDYRWWDNEKSSLSSLYCRWRDQMLSKLSQPSEAEATKGPTRAR